MIKTIIIGWVILIVAVLVGAYGVQYYEAQQPNATIRTYGDALWWSVNVSSAVGDCDICPKTTGGRVVSTFLMFIGYALFSINIAVITALFKREIDSIKQKVTR
jgi:voltage-gated potassium channel